MQDFRKLIVWDKTQDLTLRIYKATMNFPTNEKFGLIAQMRSASSSIGANIAEGCGRGSNKEFSRYLHIAIGSAFELENHILLAERLKYLDNEEASLMVEDVIELKRMLSSLIRKVKATNSIK
jgi:four helix bundle protein